MAVFLFADRSLEGNRILADLLDLSYLFDGDAHLSCDLFAGRLTSVFLEQLSGNSDQLVDSFYHMDRDTDSTGLVGNRPCDGLSDPPCSICRELISFGVVEFLYRLDKSEVTFLDKIEERKTSVEVSSGDTYNESQVGLAEFFLSFFVALLDPDSEFALFLCSQKRNFTDLFEVHSYRVVCRDVLGGIAYFDLT